MSVPLPSLVLALGASVLGAAFVSADAALGSLTTARIAALLEQEELPHRPALERYQAAPWRLRSTFVVGRVLCAALTAILLDQAVATYLPGNLGTAVAVLLALLIMAPLTELGSTLARRSADRTGPQLASWLRPFELALFPLAAPLGVVTEALADRLREPAAPDPDVMAAEVEYIVDEVERSGAVGAAPAEMIRNVLEFQDLRASDLMVPRHRIESIELRKPLAEVRRLVAESGHSRYPVFEGEPDNVVGLLCAKDVFKLDAKEGGPASLAEVVRSDVIFVPEQQKVSLLLREMRVKRQHLAVVVDEFGATSGIVTLEDLLEEIVGDIRDEHDEAEGAPIQDLGDGRLSAHATVPLGDLSAYLGADIPTEEHAAPLASVLSGEEPPVPGTTVQRWGLEFIVRDVDDAGVQRLEIVRPLTEPPRSYRRSEPSRDDDAGQGAEPAA